jgi:hypothetical protein
MNFPDELWTLIMDHLEDSRGLYLTSKRLLRAAPAGDVLYWASGCSLKYHLPKIPHDGHTLSNFAAIGNMQMVKYLCETNPISEAINDALLEVCAEVDNASMVEYLLSRGADISVYHDAPLHASINRSFINIVCLLIERRAPVRGSIMHSLSKILIKNCRLDMFKLLCDTRPDIVQNEPIFKIACNTGRVGFVRFMMARGWEINRDDSGYIRNAYSRDHLSVVNHLRSTLYQNLHAPGF